MELAPPTLPPAVSSRFRVETMLASGGFGAVWRAVDETGRAVALKVLHAETLADAQQVERFLQEARAAALLKHPSIVPLVAQGVDDGLPWIAYELIEGESLRKKIDWKQMPLEEALRYARQLAGALSAAHAAGIIHRDVKPENVLCRGDQALLTDFGIARWTGGKVKTQTGVILGTPIYMPLEILKGEPVTPAADVYAAGMVIFEMITRTLPVAGSAPVEILRALLKGAPARLSERMPDVPPALDELVARMLSGDPSSRPPDGAALERALIALDGSAVVESPSRVRIGSRAGASSRASRAASYAPSRPDRPSRATLTTGVSARRGPLALGWRAGALIFALSGLSAWLVLSHRGGQPRVVAVPGTDARGAPDPALASYRDLVHKISEAAGRGREEEVKSLARVGLSLLPKLGADRPVIEPALLGSFVDRLVTELTPFAQETRESAENWLLVREHVKRDREEHMWQVMDPPRAPRVLSDAQAAQLTERLNAALTWLPGALGPALATDATLRDEARLLRPLVKLHVFAQGWTAQPLAAALDRTIEDLLKAHPRHWVAHALEARRLIRSQNGAARPPMLRARELFEARHSADRAAGRLDSDELCTIVALASVHLTWRHQDNQKEEEGRRDFHAHIEDLRKHLSGPPPANAALLQSITREGLEDRWVKSMGFGNLIHSLGGRRRHN